MKSSLITRLYTYRFLDDFILIYPLYQVMFVARGLSITQISWLFVIWTVTALAADVPTGVLADRYSRKNLLAIGQVIRAAGFILWLVAPNFWGFAAGFALWGIGSAFDSGTFQALVFDELRLIGRQADYVKVRGRAQSYGLIGNLIATAGAALAIGLGFGGVLWLSAAAVLAAAAVAYTIPEAPRQEAAGEAGYFAELWAGTKEAVASPVLIQVILIGGFITAMFGSLEEYPPIFFQTVGLSLHMIPLAEAALVLGTVVASVVAHRYEKLPTSAFLGILALSGLLLVAAGTLKNVGGMVLLGGFFFLTKLLETIYDGKLQHSISSHRRATVTSVGGFLAELISLVVYIGFGYMAAAQGTVAAFGWFGLMIVAVAGVYLGLGRRLFALI